MGGKLFNLGRVERKKYIQIEQKVSEYLSQKIGTDAYRIPRYYHQKADFGDLDLLVSLQKNGAFGWSAFKQAIIQELHIKDFKSVGNILSISYEGLQVDFFETSAENLDIMYHYLSFNDLGNLLGKIFHRFNLKYGQDGLSYVYRHSEGNYKKEKIISRDFKKIIAFIGLKYSTWQQGFEGLEDMFEWLLSSPYFTSSPYLQPAPNTLKRIRERPTMQAFIDYLEDKQIQREYPFHRNKEVYLPLIDIYFSESNLINWMIEEQEKERITKEIHQKFNGNLVLNLLPELNTKNLGAFIVGFKNQATNFKHYILRNTEAQIQKDILEFYQTFKHNI